MCPRFIVLKGRVISIDPKQLARFASTCYNGLKTESAEDVGESGPSRLHELLDSAVAFFRRSLWTMFLRSCLFKEALPYPRQPTCLQLDTELPRFCSEGCSSSIRLALLHTRHILELKLGGLCDFRQGCSVNATSRHTAIKGCLKPGFETFYLS